MIPEINTIGVATQLREQTEECLRSVEKYWSMTYSLRTGKSEEVGKVQRNVMMKHAIHGNQ